MILTLDNLCKTFPGGTRAVDHVSLAVKPGDILCLAGASGSGKTTLLRLIAGFELPDSGAITLAGQPVVDDSRALPPEQRGIGMVFQDYALFPHLTVAKNIAFGLKRRPRRERRQRVEQLLEMIGLPGVAKRYPHQLSGGQRQRIAIARALAPEPRLVLLDEAFSSLDRATRMNLLQEVRHLLKACGATAICVTHDADDALVLADRLALLRDGKLLQAGTPDELYDYPTNAHVAQFFGATNIFPAKVENGLMATHFGEIPKIHGVNGHQHVVLSVRPHDLEIVPDGQGACGKILDVCFHGHCQELTVELLSAPDTRYRVHTCTDDAWRPGDRVHLAPRPGKLRLLHAPA